MPCQVLDRFGIDSGVDQVRDIRVAQLMRLVLKRLGVPVSDPLSTGRGIPKKEEPPTGGGDGSFWNSVSIFAVTNRNPMLF